MPLTTSVGMTCYGRCERLAAAGEDRRALVQELLTHKEDGRLKLYVTTLALNCCRMHPGLFSLGSYASQRRDGPRVSMSLDLSAVRHRAALVAVPRLIGGCSQELMKHP